ncbi:MAG: hydroxymethylbilane synthase [Verrucomicrobiota bacterium]|nr:hydroxymethylbilane synthase [Verrucomicrobiota bacterium]
MDNPKTQVKRVLIVGARSSPLSRAQVREVEQELQLHYPEICFSPVWTSSPGDRDRTTSLRSLGATDFFTRDLDHMLLKGDIRIAIHSAKDLPAPLPKGLIPVAITQGVDSRDSLVFRGSGIPHKGTIALSSVRREEALRAIDPSFRFIDLRGTIAERISLLERGEVDGVVIAEAALIRLKLTHLSRKILDIPTPPLQGKLAILAREGDEEMQKLFNTIRSLA